MIQYLCSEHARFKSWHMLQLQIFSLSQCAVCVCWYPCGYSVDPCCTLSRAETVFSHRWHACVWPGVESSGESQFVSLRLKLAWLGCRTGEIRQQIPCASWSDRLPLSAASSGFELEQWKTTPSHHGHSYKNAIFLGNCIPCLPISEANSVNVLEHTFHFVWIKCLKIGLEGK